ncbi:hypothetical protein BDN72DRAFT_864415 [Pluteus cervinus]|uniref:Uncharacterized protein n=1 Tax=Pluteus cervinus TaxID=181527 RepID=A0ACD3A3X6_9AGAR|nr:hypothetical protein BDN72DRAFT_864415 [Pluteus cervinus]
MSVVVGGYHGHLEETERDDKAVPAIVDDDRGGCYQGSLSKVGCRRSFGIDGTKLINITWECVVVVPGVLVQNSRLPLEMGVDRVELDYPITKGVKRKNEVENETEGERERERCSHVNTCTDHIRQTFLVAFVSAVLQRKKKRKLRAGAGKRERGEGKSTGERENGRTEERERERVTCQGCARRVGRAWSVVMR